MELPKIIKTIESSSDFLNLKKKYPNIFLYAIFSILDSEKFTRDLDYYLNEREVAMFSFKNEKIEMKISKLDENIVENTKKPLPISGKITLEPEIVAEIVKKELNKNEINSSISKLILTLMNQDDNNIWKVNCILTNLDILMIDVSDKDKKVIKFEKKSLGDFVKYMKK
jgi:hypothetical protein